MTISGDGGGVEARARGQIDRSVIDCKTLYQEVLGNVAKFGIDMLKLYELLSLQLCDDAADEEQDAVVGGF